MTIGGKIGMPKKTRTDMFGLREPDGKSVSRRCVSLYAAGAKATAFLLFLAGFFLAGFFLAVVAAGGGGVCT
jgi:hypothetical protein